MNKDAKKESKQRSWDKKYREAPYIECACGCGAQIKNVDRYGRPKKFISGHNVRKYPEGYCAKKAYYDRHKDEVKARSKKNKSKRKEFHKKEKVRFILKKGGKCISCDYIYNGKNAAGFDFHHRDPKGKEFGICNGIRNKSKKRVEREVEKCELMCSNCHNIYHIGEY